MNKLVRGLGMDVREIAQSVGVTVQTVRAWIAGTRKPAERNRIKLARMVEIAQRENSSAGHRFNTGRDRILCDLRATLRSAAEQKIFERDRQKMRDQFAPRRTRDDVWASYRDMAERNRADQARIKAEASGALFAAA